MNQKLKQSVAIGLASVFAIIGSLKVSEQVDTNKFIERAERGELYATQFNRKIHNEYGKYLVEKVPSIERPHYQELQVFLKMCSKEAKKEGGWTLGDVNDDNILDQLSNHLNKSLNK